jgi:hypothetical protein
MSNDDGMSRRDVMIGAAAASALLALPTEVFAAGNPVADYLNAVRADPKKKEELEAIHKKPPSEGNFGEIRSHAAKSGFNFSRDELVTFVAGAAAAATPKKP